MGRSRRAKSTWIALREMRDPSLLVSLDYLALLAELKPERFPAAAVRLARPALWLNRLNFSSCVTDKSRHGSK
jgi:hypothetical protein